MKTKNNEVKVTNVNKREAQEEVKAIVIDNVSVKKGKAPILTFSFPDYLLGGKKSVSMELTKINPKSLRNQILKNNGICEDSELQYKQLMKSYNKSAMQHVLKIIRKHDNLGWELLDDKELVFYGDTAVSERDDIQSEYDGALDIKPKGSIEKIVTMIKKQILDIKEWSPMQAVIAFSASATVLPFVKTFWGVDLDNPILHLHGGSTSGKSTVLKLNAGLGSNPAKKKAFWLTHESSLVALIKRIGNNMGYPVSIDELSSAKRKEYDEFVYSLGNGEEKDRVKAGGVGLQESASFSTVIMSSGEVSLLRKCSSNEGIRARCIEISNVTWTASKEQANEIKRCMRYNYGFLPELIAKELLKNTELWKTRWSEISRDVEMRIEKDKIMISIIPRVADYVTLFILAAEIVNKVLNIKLDVKKIYDFCYMHIVVANADEANMAQRVYDTLLEHYGMHRDLFPEGEYYGCKSQNNVYSLNPEEEGFTRSAYRKRTVNGVVMDRQIVFRLSSIERILDEKGFSVKVALNKLKDAKLLGTKDDRRYTSKVTINDVEQDVVIIYVKDGSFDGIDLDEWC